MLIIYITYFNDDIAAQKHLSVSLKNPEVEKKPNKPKPCYPCIYFQFQNNSWNTGVVQPPPFNSKED